MNKIKYYGTEYEIRFKRGHYRHDDSLAIQVECKTETSDWEPFCMLTVNLNQAVFGEEAYLDVNNCPKEVLDIVSEHIVDVLCYCNSGFVTYPLVHFDSDWLDSLEYLY